MPFDWLVGFPPFQDSLILVGCKLLKWTLGSKTRLMTVTWLLTSPPTRQSIFFDWQYFPAGLNSRQAFPWWSRHHPWRTRTCPHAGWSRQNPGSPLPCSARTRVSTQTHTRTMPLLQNCSHLLHNIATNLSIAAVATSVFVCIWMSPVVHLWSVSRDAFQCQSVLVMSSQVRVRG